MAATIKLSLKGKGSRPRPATLSRPKHEEGDRELVQSVTSDGVELVMAQKRKRELVIPVASNPWETKVASGGSLAPADGAGAGIRVSSRGGEEVPAGVATVDDLAREALLADARGEKGTRGANSSFVIAMPDTGAGGKRPLLASNMVPGLLELEGDDARFRHDLSMRAADVDPESEVYQAVPVEDFGAALLRGMGWAGPSADDVAPAAPEARVQRLGLGAKPRVTEERDPKRAKNGGDEPGKPAPPKLSVMDVVVFGTAAAAAASASGTVVPVGHRAMVLQSQNVGIGKVKLRLEGSGEEVIVPNVGFSLVSEYDKAKRPFELKRSSATAAGPQDRRNSSRPSGEGSSFRDERGLDRGSSGDNGALASRSRHGKGRHGGSDRRDSGQAKYRKEKRDEGTRKDDTKMSKDALERSSDSSGSSSSWVTAEIRIRIVSRSYGSAHDGKKGLVVSPGSKRDGADIKLDGSGVVLRGVKHKHLETVVPSAGGRVMVVRGKHAKTLATVVRKDAEKGRATVELMHGDGERLEVSLDDIAETASM